MSAHDWRLPAATQNYQGDAMKEIPKKDRPDVAGGVNVPEGDLYPKVPCFPWKNPEDGPLVPDFDESPCQSPPTA